ncbi:hypothetical protein jhhlp_001559 [Lomentospora prolificans]|uniref:Peroxisomal membrane protein PEX14 n=1 Tax=Lomentospora prolificans TaxID=41688 RepID=A0A2N3NIH5_9PEZI|nr:hypothetical protein jhhlp_001559 [Lomentospora prolificans]
MTASEDKRPVAEAVATEPTPTPEGRLEVARRFLEDETVKNSPREKQIEFLRSKELSDEEIQSLLGPGPTEHTSASPDLERASPETPDHHSSSEGAPRPPIITYPEFLTKPADPEPLLTPTLVLNSAYALTGLTTLLYGTKKYLVDPMIAQLTAARLDLHETASSNLSTLNEKLENIVSEVPSRAVLAIAHDANDSSSECEDPSELFHRDVGTQTSGRSTPVLTPSEAVKEPVAQTQTRKLATLARSLADVKEGLDTQVDDIQDILAGVDNLKEDLRQSSVARSYASLGWKQQEPDDEVKKAKENIRRLKGVFLSTRNFPVSTK